MTGILILSESDTEMICSENVLLLVFFPVQKDFISKAVCYVEQVAKTKKETASRQTSRTVQVARQAPVAEIKRVMEESPANVNDTDSESSVWHVYSLSKVKQFFLQCPGI